MILEQFHSQCPDNPTVHLLTVGAVSELERQGIYVKYLLRKIDKCLIGLVV